MMDGIVMPSTWVLITIIFVSAVYFYDEVKIHNRIQKEILIELMKISENLKKKE